MRHRLNKTIVLVGMMGAGKTAVGRALAAKIGAPFLDSDAEIVQAANMSIPEIFARDGEPFFRARETEVIRRLLNAPEKSVLSTGGGAFLSEENRALISQLGVSVFLQADLDLLWSRVGHKDTRPLLRTANPRATLAELFEARAPVYARADLCVTAKPAYSIAQMADKVLSALTARADVMETEDD
ncbi:shikimate kinase [uncultured Lentibacter sp.]|uniref:shikimate kinase n=1 Tax=uncultured Lentibacter sp. TaxID=1659309 RepID=UPI0026199210|nr:shikimate kinase [uncultured Lentibacter sp.]MCW1954625.1 shikimate kinase [Roseobacter sp.]